MNSEEFKQLMEKFGPRLEITERHWTPPQPPDPNQTPEQKARTTCMDCHNKFTKRNPSVCLRSNSNGPAKRRCRTCQNQLENTTYFKKMNKQR